jgi:hypothetical protein
MMDFCLASEEWREYEFGGKVYRISNPARLFIRVGGSTHRILDGVGIVHCVPAPGEHGCILRWKTRDGFKPCEF